MSFFSPATFPAGAAATVKFPSLLRRRLCNSSHLPSSDQHYSSLIDSSLHPAQIQQIHARLLSIGLLSRGFLLTKLVHACSRLGEVAYGRTLFESHPLPDIFLWNAAVKLHSGNGDFLETISIYARMLYSGVRPDRFTFPSVIRACFVNLENARKMFDKVPERRVGAVHAQAFRHGFSSDLFIQNGLVAVYSKLPKMGIARKVFDEIPERNRDVVSWTCVISGCAQSGKPLEALEIFSRMRSSEHFVAPDFVSLVSVLKACSDLGELLHGRALHGLAAKCGFDEEDDLQISLTAFYAQCGDLDQARAVFNLTAAVSRSRLLWNSMISGYAKNGDPLEALNLFDQLVIHPHLNPDSITVRAAIMAAARFGSLQMAKKVQSYAQSKELNHDMLISTALIDMYSKCGSINLARKVFDEMPQRDVVAWSAIISGYALHGHGRKAITLFHEMQLAGVSPNSVTFLSLLSACNHSGLVSEGREIFAAMKAHGVEPLPRHYACVIDLLGRAGMVAEACELMAEMSTEPTVAAWGALLSACRSLGDVPTGELAAEKVLALDPLNVGHLVQLSNLFAGAGMWAAAGRVRAMMRDKRLVKVSGESVVEVDGTLWEFKCDDRSHPASDDIYEMMYVLEIVSKEGRAKSVYLDAFLDYEFD